MSWQTKGEPIRDWPVRYRGIWCGARRGTHYYRKPSRINEYREAVAHDPGYPPVRAKRRAVLRWIDEWNYEQWRRGEFGWKRHRPTQWSDRRGK